LEGINLLEMAATNIIDEITTISKRRSELFPELFINSVPKILKNGSKIKNRAGGENICFILFTGR
jgi:hypothetical protein